MILLFSLVKIICIWWVKKVKIVKDSGMIAVFGLMFVFMIRWEKGDKIVKRMINGIVWKIEVILFKI